VVVEVTVRLDGGVEVTLGLDGGAGAGVEEALGLDGGAGAGVEEALGLDLGAGELRGAGARVVGFGVISGVGVPAGELVVDVGPPGAGVGAPGDGRRWDNGVACTRTSIAVFGTVKG
jgi:hypothetical protein